MANVAADDCMMAVTTMPTRRKMMMEPKPIEAYCRSTSNISGFD